MKATREPAARNFRADLLPKNWPVGIPHDEPAHKRDHKAAVAREPGRALRNKFRMPAILRIDAAAPAARAHCCTLRGRPMGLVGRSSWACAAI